MGRTQRRLQTDSSGPDCPPPLDASPVVDSIGQRPPGPHRLRRAWRRDARALGGLSAGLAWVQFNFCLTGLVDMALAGRAGSLELGACGLGAAFFTVAGALGQMGGLGAEPFIAQALGAGRPDDARQWLHQGLWAAALTGLPVMLLAGLAALGIPHLGIAPALAAAAQNYLLGRLPGLPCFALVAVLRAYLQAAHATGAVARSALVMNLFNLVCASLFLFGDAGLELLGLPAVGMPALGVFGLGLASTLATGLQLLMLAVAVWRHGDRRASPGRQLQLPSLQPQRIARVVRVGLPVALHLLAEVGIFTLAGFTVGGMGEAAMAAHQAALMIATTSFHLCLGIADATAVQVGRAVGARDGAATRRHGVLGLALSVLTMSLSAGLMLMFPATLLGLISPDPQVVAAAIDLLAIAAVFQLVDGLQAVAAGALRGCGHTRISFVANLLAHWGVGVPAIYVLTRRLKWGPEGVWWGLVAGLSVAAVTLIACFFRATREQVAALEA